MITFSSYSGGSLELDYTKITENNPEPLLVEQKALDGTRKWVNRSLYFYSFIVMLHKYANPNAKLTEILGYLNTYGFLDFGDYVFRSNDTNGAPFTLYFYNANPGYLEQTGMYDFVRLDFITVNQQEPDVEYWIDDDGEFILNDDGTKIIVDL